MMKKHQIDSAAPRNFRDAIDMFLGKGTPSPDIGLAGFLAEHAGVDRNASIASIGPVPSTEALTLNSLVSREAAYVLLGSGTLADSRGFAAELTNEIEASGFEVKVQFADLTMAGRWPQLLNAITKTSIGILGVDAHWASSEPRFWASLDQFMKDGKSLTYIRRMFDFQNSQASFSLIRSMPAHWEQNVVVATPTSIWFAHEAENAARVREILRQSGIFPEDVTRSDDEHAEGPVVIRGERSLERVDRTGRFPRAVLFTNDRHRVEIEFKSGWSMPEVDGCWTDSKESVMQARMPPSMLSSPTTVKVSGNAWVGPHKSQIVELGLGNEPSEWIEKEFTDSQQIRTFTLDSGKLKDISGGLELRIRVRNPGSPSEYGEPDKRLLGFKCRAISLFA